MNKTIRELQARKAAQVQAARALTEKASAEARDLTVEEQTEFDKISASIKSTNAAIEREQMLAAEEAGIRHVATTPAATIPFGEGQVVDRAESDATRGFQSFGEFAYHVKNAGVNRGAVDDRLMIGAAAPGTYGGEASGVDGGFLVPPQFANDIFTLSMAEQALLPLTDQVEITGNSMVFPKDETVPWGTDGIRAYWQSEATSGSPTKPKLGVTQQRLHKLMALVPISDELLSDTNALESYIPGKIAASIRWKTDEALLWGTGNGTPIGCMQSNAVIVAAKDSGQATNTLSASNVARMMAAMPQGSYGRAVWLINNDVLPALFTLTLGNYPIYMPATGTDNRGGIQLSPFGNLLGRPIIVTQHAKSFSSQGDVSLVDLSYVRSIVKSGGMQSATSMHLYFDADATAFRTIFRLDAQPKILNKISPQNGSNYLSPFVQLAAR